jgi:arylformamidase
VSAISELTSAAERNASRSFLIEAATGRELTHGEAWGRALALARALHEHGLRRGDRLAVSLPNSLELALIYEAALLGGIVIAPLGSGFGRRELRDILSRAQPRLVLTGPEEHPLATVAADLDVATSSVSIGSVTGDLDVWELPDVDDEPFAEMSDDDLVSVHFTSGSTGTPRGVAHRLRDFVDNAARYAEANALDETHRFHHSLPMTYMAGYYNLILMPLRIGASVVLDRAFDARSVLRYWDVPREHGVDVIWVVPTIMAMLLKVDRGEVGRAYCRQHVRHVASGTAPLGPELREEFERSYGITVHDGYGLSETLLLTSSTPKHPSKRGSVGRALPGVELRVSAQAGEPGPILARSPDTMLGYLEGWDKEQGPRLQAPAQERGWFATGDIGVLDADGELRITGREKDIIIRGGVNISAAEVEGALDGEEGVAHLAVVGVPHEILGEQVAAIVATRDGRTFDEVESSLKARARSQAAPKPDIYVHIDAMPITPTGKVRKGALRDMVIDALGLPERAKGFTVDAPDPSVGAGEAPDRTAPWDGGVEPIDLTHPIREGMVSFPSPNHPAPEVTVLARHARDGRMTRRLVLGTHTGTHLDAPLHFVPGGDPVESIRLERLVGAAHVADLSSVEPRSEVSREVLERALGGRPRHRRVLLGFDWSRRFVDLRFYSDSPYLSESACRWLIDCGVDVLGMDTPSPDDPSQGQGSEIDSPNHQLLLGAGCVLLEYLANLDQLASEVFLVALPLPVEGGDGAPMRVIAFT